MVIDGAEKRDIVSEGETRESEESVRVMECRTRSDWLRMGELDDLLSQRITGLITGREDREREINARGRDREEG